MFAHRDSKEAALQVPAGRLDPGETLEQGLARELHEEAGIHADVLRELGSVTRDHGDPYGVLESHYFHLQTDDPREAWEHVVTGDGDDAGFVFLYRFVPLDPPPQLAGRQGEFLHLL